MPTKRRPLKHAPRLGEGVRVTSRMLDVYRKYQVELRDDLGSIRNAELQHALHHMLRHLPWGDQKEQEAEYRQLHLLAYPAATRPQRLDCMGRPAGLNEHDEVG